MLLAISICVVGVIVSFIREQPFRRGLWRRWHWLIFSQMLFFPALVAVGVLLSAPSGPPHSQVNLLGERVLDGLFYLSLATGIFWRWRMKGMQWLVTSLLLVQQVILVGAGIVAVSGDWL